MAIQLKEVRSTEEKVAVFQLRYNVFIKEEKRFHLSADYLFDRFDSFAETINFLAYHDGKPVAGIRLVLENPSGLPAEEAFDFSGLRGTLSGGCATVGWFCVRKAYRHNPGLVVSLIQMCFRRMRQHHARHVLAVVHPPAMALMKRLVGARPLSPAYEDPHLKVGIIPVHVDLENLPAGSRERFVDPECRMLEDSHQRRLYGQNEVICPAGDNEKAVYQVMRGVVRRQMAHRSDSRSVGLSGAPQFRYLGPGEYFGELSVLDEKSHPDSMIAHSGDVDLMVWERRVFLDQLKDSSARAMGFYMMMADRLRRFQALKETDDPSQSLAARLLVEASVNGSRPVDARWLAGQCGMDTNALSTLVTPWEKAQLIAADAQQRRFWVIDQPQLAQVANL